MADNYEEEELMERIIRGGDPYVHEEADAPEDVCAQYLNDDHGDDGHSDDGTGDDTSDDGSSDHEFNGNEHGTGSNEDEEENADAAEV